MKKLFPLLIIPFLLTGCIKYGTGQQTGYVYSVDDGILSDKVWIKNSANASGNGDQYCISDDSVKQQLANLSSDQQVTIKYDRHMFTFATCPTSDVITSFTLTK